jgi:hypothetical protein
MVDWLEMEKGKWYKITDVGRGGDPKFLNKIIKIIEVHRPEMDGHSPEIEFETQDGHTDQLDYNYYEFERHPDPTKGGRRHRRKTRKQKKRSRKTRRR